MRLLQSRACLLSTGAVESHPRIQPWLSPFPDRVLSRRPWRCRRKGRVAAAVIDCSAGCRWHALWSGHESLVRHRTCRVQTNQPKGGPFGRVCPSCFVCSSKSSSPSPPSVPRKRLDERVDLRALGAASARGVAGARAGPRHGYLTARGNWRQHVVLAFICSEIQGQSCTVRRPFCQPPAESPRATDIYWGCRGCA